MSLTPTTSWWCRSNDIVSSPLPCFSFFLSFLLYLFTHFRFFFTKQSTKSIKNTRQRTLGDRPTDPPIMLTYFKNALCKREQRTWRVFCSVWEQNSSIWWVNIEEEEWNECVKFTKNGNRDDMFCVLNTKKFTLKYWFGSYFSVC